MFPFCICVAIFQIIMFPQSDLLLSAGKSSLAHGFFDRHNGVGSCPYNSLNVNFFVGDDRVHVKKNRTIVKEMLGIDYLVSAKQVHGNQIVTISDEISEDFELEGYDGLITDQKGVGLMIQQADCQAVLLFDPVRPAIGALHCGWRGSVADIIFHGVMEMTNHFHSNPGKMVAAISPSLGPCCCEFIHHHRELPDHFQEFQVKKDYFDFWRISTKQLINCGFKKSAISVNGICTCCHSDYFSYRSAKKEGLPITGRNCSVIGLKE